MGKKEQNITWLIKLILKSALIVVCLFISQISFSQSEGDFRSKSGGAWQSAANWEVFSFGSWIDATEYPGQFEGDYSVLIQYGHNITISNAGISTNYFSKLTVSGKLTLNGGSTSGINFIINVSEIYVTPWLSPYATIEFNLKSVLWMPQYAIIRVWTGGLTGSCNNNQEIRLGYNSPITFAHCNGAPGYIFTFEELMAGGGTINAVVSASPSEVCIDGSISLSGSYTGAIANAPTYLWSSSGPSSLSFNSSATTQNPTITPSVAGEYIIRLAVSTENEGLVYTNVDSISITVGKKSENPVSASASKTTVMIGVSTTLTLSGGGGGYPEIVRWYSDENCTSLVGEGNDLVVIPLTETTYYGRYENSSPCSFNTEAVSILINVIDFANVWEGNIDTDFGKAGNWQGNIVPSNGENIYFADSPLNNCVLDRDFIVDNLINGSNKSFDLNNKELTILDDLDFFGSGTMISQNDNSILKYGGSENQILESVDFLDEHVSNLQINNSSSVELSGALRVSKSLTLDQGNFIIGDNQLTLNCNITVVAGTIIGGNSSDLSIENPLSNVYLPIAELKKLEIETTGIVELTQNLKIFDSLLLYNGVLDLNNRLLELSGYVATSGGKIDASDDMSQIEFSNLQELVLPQNLFVSFISNLKINGAGITLGENITVNSQLQFNSGNIITLNDTLILTKSAFAIIGSDAGKCVHGFLRKVGNTGFVFPVGYEDYFAPIVISDASAGGSDTCWFTASYYHEMPHNYYDSSLHSIDIVRISQMEFWLLDRYGENEVSVTLTWDERSGIITDPSKLTIAQWNGALWLNAGVVAKKSFGDLTSPVLSSFSPFTLASKDYYENTLPVEIIDYKMICENNDLVMTWTSVSEENCDYFEIQSANDELKWVSISQIPGAGNSSEKVLYSRSIDEDFIQNKYFRLVQFDFDGSSNDFPILVSKQCSDHLFNQNICAYPNPFTSNISFDLSKLNYQNGYSVKVYDQLFRLIHIEKSNDMIFVLSRDVITDKCSKSGLFNVLIETEDKMFNLKIVLSDL